MGARPKVNWLAVRSYFSSGHSTIDCATKFHVSKRQIERHASDENWKNERRDNVIDATQKLKDRVAADLDDQFLDHEAFVKQTAELVAGFKQDLEELKPGRSRAEVRKIAVESAERLVRMSRLVRGVRDGEKSAKDEVDDKNLTIRRLIIPAPIRNEATA